MYINQKANMRVSHPLILGLALTSCLTAGLPQAGMASTQPAEPGHVLLPSLTERELNDHEPVGVTPTSINAPQLMVKVAPIDTDIDAGATTTLTYTVINVGNTIAEPGANVLIRLPESVTCNDIGLSGDASIERCVNDGPVSSTHHLLSGDYVLARINDQIGAADPSSAQDEKTFQVNVTTSPTHMGGTRYTFEAGIVAYRPFTSPGDKPSTYVPSHNIFCKPSLANDNERCALLVAQELYPVGTQPLELDDLGSLVNLTDNTGPGGLATMVSTTLHVREGRLSVDRLSNGMTGEEAGRDQVVPGEPVGLTLTLSPPPSTEGQHDSLVGANPAEDTTLMISITGIEPFNPDDEAPFMLQYHEEVIDRFVDAFGNNIDRTRSHIVSTQDGYAISIAFHEFPGRETTIELPQLFLATTTNPTVEGHFRYKPVDLIHRDHSDGARRLHRRASTERITELREQKTFTTVHPQLEVNKMVLPSGRSVVSGADVLDYTITVHNPSTVTAYEVQFNDVLPEGFSFLPELTVTLASGGPDSASSGVVQWATEPDGRTAHWPDNRSIFIPPGGSAKLEYQVKAPDTVIDGHAYTSQVTVPFASQYEKQAGIGRYSQTVTSALQGIELRTETTVFPLDDPRGDGSLRHGEAIATKTRVTLPPGMRVPNLSSLTKLSGATIDRSHAVAAVTCSPEIACAPRPALLDGHPNDVGVVLANGPIANTTNHDVTITLTVSNLIVTGGDGPVQATAGVYRHQSPPSSTGDIEGGLGQSKLVATPLPISPLQPPAEQPGPNGGQGAQDTGGQQQGNRNDRGPGPGLDGRPSTIPSPPAAPKDPPPVTAGHIAAIAEPEERAKRWVQGVFGPEDRAETVLIGRDNVFADSLSSGGLQGILNAPLLLNSVNRLSDGTKAALEQLNPKRVIILGGTQAIGSDVEAELSALGWNVSRVHGSTRIETAIAAANQEAPQATEAVLARAYDTNGGSSSQAFADTLSGGVLAATRAIPVLLTTSDHLAPPLRAYLRTSKIRHLTILGAQDAISEEVEAELEAMGITTSRIAGENRAHTAIKVAHSMGYWNASESRSVLVVNGEREDAWSDAFTAALFAKRYALPMVLSADDALLPETKTWVEPGLRRTPPTRIICGFSTGPLPACGYSAAPVGP